MYKSKTEVENIFQMVRAKKKTVTTRIQCYLSNVYNIVDLVAALCVILYFLGTALRYTILPRFVE